MFFLYIKTYTVLKTDKQFQMFFFIKYVVRTIRKVLNNLTVFYICLVIRTSCSLYLIWLTKVCLVVYVGLHFCVCDCVCLWVCISQYVHVWLTWRVVLPIDLPSVTGQERQSPSCKKKKFTACNYTKCVVELWKHCYSTLAWYIVSPFLLYRTAVPFQGTFCQYILPKHVMYVTL